MVYADPFHTVINTYIVSGNSVKKNEEITTYYYAYDEWYCCVPCESRPYT